MLRISLILCLLWLLTGGSRPALAEASRVGELGAWAWRLELPRAQADRNADADLDLAGQRLQQHWKLLAQQGEGSELVQVNALAGQRSARLSPFTFHALISLMEWRERSHGAVEVLAGPLHRWWGLRDGTTPAHYPTEVERDSLLALVQRGGTYVVELGVLLRDRGMELDVDPCLPALLVDATVDSLQALGHAPRMQCGEVWRNVSPEVWNLQLPATQAAPAMDFPLTEGALARVRAIPRASLDRHATSSLIDPRTALPVCGVEAWVLAPTALEAQAMAHSLAILGMEEFKPLNGRFRAVLALQQADASWQWQRLGDFPVIPAMPADTPR